MDFAPISFLFLLTGAISVALANYAWQRRATSGSQSFALFMLAVAIYGLGYGMELASPNLESALFWSKVQYIGILTFPTMYLVFTIQYIGRSSWLTPRNLGFLFALPLAFLIAKFFDTSLHWIYASAQAEVINSALLLTFVRGPLYMPIAIYQLAVVTIGNILLLQKWRFSSQLYRQQTAILLAAAVIPYLAYIAYLLNIRILPLLDDIDINPLSYAIWAAIASVAISRYGFLKLAPIARDALIERLNDGVVVLDSQTRLVDANPRALKIFGWPGPPIGELVHETIKLGDWLNRDLFSTVGASFRKDTSLAFGADIFYYQVDISTLHEKNGRRIGYLLLIHDITDQKEIEKKFEALSITDELTGLNNRRGFNVLADQLIGVASRLDLNAVMFYVDLDGLKRINDELGHAFGDEALKEVASILKDSFRSTDILARLGGDEFVVLAIETQENSTAMMLERLRQNVTRHKGLHQTYEIAMSIGQSHYAYSKPKTIADLIKESDRSMYEDKKAKGIGRSLE